MAASFWADSLTSISQYPLLRQALRIQLRLLRCLCTRWCVVMDRVTYSHSLQLSVVHAKSERSIFLRNETYCGTPFGLNLFDLIFSEHLLYVFLLKVLRFLSCTVWCGICRKLARRFQLDTIFCNVDFSFVAARYGFKAFLTS